MAVSLTGWGSETEPSAQFIRDLPQLLVAIAAGVLSGTCLAWSIFGARRGAVWVGAVVGTLPALIRVSSYFTDVY